ncbi:hypothetical protein HRR83_006819 [Exophiala dermatitidis]|uniref:Uncharacterized protein n=1 Tax=Exophiala dermatitidis TaxID=5970 RepID=A0AAN6ITJ6_EXODE|nr:hypothetical protein HRR73_005858 [Exophiala dermatitidis]KAJ4512819.1 hypothetical protein HRR74_006517 [Exophiala dermatitidis]KAJ4542630.1 hypothetical protein HRR77_005823 [Exophiala dermatitidis]KAJ4548318.1 hypothetical protein HRR76_000922 [Exophiala dermatitidis]KAJ4570149.1 hypothetical protein HRR82_007361 [Exophiala dermatitidis]
MFWSGDRVAEGKTPTRRLGRKHFGRVEDLTGSRQARRTMTGAVRRMRVPRNLSSRGKNDYGDQYRAAERAVMRVEDAQWQNRRWKRVRRRWLTTVSDQLPV